MQIPKLPLLQAATFVLCVNACASNPATHCPTNEIDTESGCRRACVTWSDCPAQEYCASGACFACPADGCPIDLCEGRGHDDDGDQICGDMDNCGDDPNPEQLDADGDGVGDACDACPGGADDLDSDGDDTPDGCDLCPGFDDRLDQDSDTVADGCDLCAAGDDLDDSDGDTTPDDCDLCPGWSDADDIDGDGRADGCDTCAGFDDNLDADNDTVADGCDTCAGANDLANSDGDAFADACDHCPAWHNDRAPGVIISGPASATPRGPIALTIDVDCPNVDNDIVCTVPAVRAPLAGPETFEGNLGGFSEMAGWVLNADCDAGVPSISPTGGIGCQANDGNGDVLGFSMNGVARRDGIDASGASALRIDLDSALSLETEAGEDIDLFTCCNSDPCTTLHGTIENLDSGGADVWSARGPFELPASLDGCASLAVRFVVDSNTSNEFAQIDNFVLTGETTVTLELDSAGPGSYSTSLTTWEPAVLGVSCTWTTAVGVFDDVLEIDVE